MFWSIHSDEEPPFRALDLLETDTSFPAEVGASEESIPAEISTDFELVDPPGEESLQFDFDFGEEQNSRHESGHKPQGIEELVPESAAERFLRAETESMTEVQGSVLNNSEWNFMIAANFSQYREQHHGMQYPWEQGVLSDIFGTGQQLLLPTCEGLAEPSEVVVGQAPAPAFSAMMEQLPVDAKYVKVVSTTKDLEYFEAKNQKLELACGQWLELMSISWKSFGVGTMVSDALHSDPSGAAATEILRASFGIKSPSTLLKRASSFRQFVRWYDRTGYGVDTLTDPFPLRASAVWDYFMFLRNKRLETNSGFTNPASFLETVRFAKFTVDLKDADTIISSRRLLGFAAIEKKNKGPTKTGSRVRNRTREEIARSLDGRWKQD